jgi:SAM-dependent methyltransferase
MQSQTALIEAVSRPYRAAGHWAYYFARAKLTHDPIYLTLLRSGRFSDRARVLDLGCGHAFLAALMLTAREHYESGMWRTDWRAPPAELQFIGIDSQSRVVTQAKLVLGDRVVVHAADLCEAPLPQADVAVAIDVLQCLQANAQVTLLTKIARSLSGGGLLVLRVPDAAGGWRASFGKASDRFGVPFAKRVFATYHHRTLREWLQLLHSLGFEPSVDPSRQTFANTVLWAKAPQS